MKAHAVCQTAGEVLHGDLHLRRSVLTTSINHQSNFYVSALQSLNFTLRAHA